jgi:predicted acyl esterase
VAQHEGTPVIERDVPIPVDDATVLRADVFRPADGGPWPAILTAGPYGKGLPFSEGVFAERYQRLVSERPEVLDGSSGAHLCWETVDPEQWVPHGYAVVRIDSRGAGRTPGTMDLLGRRERRDFALAIEWAGDQPWCSGRVGLSGVSYYAITQWAVAALRPRHLAAIIPWEGASDHYRDMTHHGGILSNAFFDAWYPRQVLSMQHGLGTAGPESPWVPDGLAAGPETLGPEELAARRTDYLAGIRAHDLDDAWHRERSAELAGIEVPLLSAANWGGLGLHSRGNFEGFAGASSEHRWLDVHTGRHEEEYYVPAGRELQRAFFDRFLHGRDNDWERRDPVTFVVRDPLGGTRRAGGRAWPLPGTRWEHWQLEGPGRLRPPADGPPEPAGTVHVPAQGEGTTFVSEPLARPCTLVGPAAAHLYVSSSGADADVFCTLRAFLPSGDEVTFRGANDPQAPLSQGWLRLSHRELDPARSRPDRPWHRHERRLPVRPGTAYEAAVELWPTCVRLPPGSRLAVTVGGSDFARPGSTGPFAGSGPFRHDDAHDRRQTRDVTLGVHTGGRTPSSILLPLVELPGVD